MAYARDKEAEADRLAVPLLVRADIDPHAMLRLFEKMAAARPGRVITIVDDDRPERHFAVIAVPPNFVNE